MRRSLALPLCLLLLLATAGCADPTADKPKAVVDEPTAEPARAADSLEFVLAEESSIGFVGSKVTGSHDGGFNEFEGRIAVAGGDPTQATVEVTIDTASLWTDTERLTGHLKSSDFFDVEQFPSATFVSTSIEPEGDGYRITGNLTLHGVTKSIAFPASIDLAEERIEADAEFSIKRFDFDIVYPGKTDDLIRDDVLIKLDLVATPV